MMGTFYRWHMHVSHDMPVPCGHHFYTLPTYLHIDIFAPVLVALTLLTPLTHIIYRFEVRRAFYW